MKINLHARRAADLVGGQTELARLLSAAVDPSKPAPKPITVQAVHAWVRTGHVPAGRVLDIERVTQGRVTRHDLRPDLYPTAIPDYLAA